MHLWWSADFTLISIIQEWNIKNIQWVSGIYILGSKMIIFESILTTFEVSFIFWTSWGSIENWLELKIEPPLANLALLNPLNTLCRLKTKLRITWTVFLPGVELSPWASRLSARKDCIKAPASDRRLHADSTSCLIKGKIKVFDVHMKKTIQVIPFDINSKA
jgi:hypothetical protein